MRHTALRMAIIALVVLVGFAGIGQAASSTPPTIGLVMKTLTNPFFISMEKGAREAEKELNLRLVVKTGAKETSIDQQIAIVEEMIRDKVAAIVIAPGSSTDLVPVLKKAQTARIPIVNIDNRLDPDLSKRMGLSNVPFISVDNVQGGYQSAHYIAQDAPGGTQAGILEGIRSAANAQQRRAGAVKAFGEIGTIRIVATETANWKIDEAMAVTTKMLRDHPEISLLFCANDMMALGAIQAIQSIGRPAVKVAGYDALDEALDAIRQGKLEATIDQQAAVQGYRGIRAAVDLMRGMPVPLEMLVSTKLITRGTLR